MLNSRYLSRRETVERSPGGADPKTGSGVSSRGLGLSVVGLAVIDDLRVLEEAEEGDEDRAEKLTSVGGLFWLPWALSPLSWPGRRWYVMIFGFCR